MKETVKSLRAYFIIAGLLSAFSALSNLGEPSFPLGLKILFVAWIGIDIAMIYVGARLKQLLVSSPDMLLKFVLAAGAFAVLSYAGIIVWVARAASLAAVPASLYVWAVVSLAIYAYLYVNVKRLAAEAQNGE